MTSTAFHNVAQPQSCIRDDLSVDEIIKSQVPTRQINRFFDALPGDEDITFKRWEVIELYEGGAIGAFEALNTLEAFGCVNGLDDVMDAYCAGIRAITGVDAPTPPEPAQSALQPPSDDLLQTVAKVRQTSWRAA